MVSGRPAKRKKQKKLDLQTWPAHSQEQQNASTNTGNTAPFHLPGGVPKKGVNKANKDFSPNCSLKFRVQKLRLLAFTEGPGGFRELREAGRNHFHLSWYLLVPGVTSYGLKKEYKGILIGCFVFSLFFQIGFW